MDITITRPSSAEVNPRSKFRADKPPIGGWLPALVFTPAQTATLHAIVDQLIPPGDGFPAPSQVNVIHFFGKYIAPEGHEPKWFPFFGETEFRAWLDALEGFAQLPPREQIRTLETLEQTDGLFFARVRDLTYYAYYSRPPVINAINENLKAGKDLRNSPQPYGYSDTMDDWDEELLNRVRGNYTRTEDVRPVNVPEGLRCAGRNQESQVRA